MINIYSRIYFIYIYTYIYMCVYIHTDTHKMRFIIRNWLMR